MMTVENYQMNDLDLDDEIVYSEEEIDAIYREYQERVRKKYELKIMLKKAGII